MALTRAPLALRIALIVGLLALTVAGITTGEERGRVWRLTGGEDDAAAIAALLLSPAAPAAVLRGEGTDPTELELQALAGAAERAPLIVALPREPPTLTAAPPDAPRAGRYAAVGFTAHAEPGDTVGARLLDARDGAVDSIRVVADRGGSASGGFRVRPAREGWVEWRVAADGRDEAVRRVGAWVGPAGPPRVLVVAGAPSWESRYVVRALERSGAAVSLVQQVGRENVITGGDVRPDWGARGVLEGHDVVVLLQGAEPDEGVVRALETWVAGGKGVAVASGGAAAMAFGGSGGPGTARRPEQHHRGNALVWSAPAEIAPLPPAEIEVAAAAMGPARPGVAVAARGQDGDPLLLLTPFGRGRAAVLAIRETWRWTMEAGLEPEHQAFWRSLVDYLAVPSTDSLGVRVDPVAAEAGSTVELWSRGASLAIRRPGAAEAEAVPFAAGDSAWSARFVPIDTGLHEVRAPGEPVAAFRSRPPDGTVPARLGRARLSLLAAASGGELLGPEAFAARAAALGAAADTPARWPPVAFALLALLAVTEWALRRLRGLP